LAIPGEAAEHTAALIGERGFGGSAPPFHVDGATVIGSDADFSDPQALNARFFSTVQILHDLKLVAGD